MRYREICEGKWWDGEETITLYHGTSSALLPEIQKNGLKPPDADLRAYALDVLAHYVPDRKKWTKKLLQLVDEHAVRLRGGRGGEDRGPVIYCMTDLDGPTRYAQGMAQHGGEIARDVYQCVRVAFAPKGMNIWIDDVPPPMPPRYPEGKPIVLELEVPKSWCIFHFDIEEYRLKMTKAWDDGKTWAREFPTLGEFLDDCFDNREVRIGRIVPPEMIRRVRYIG